MDIDTTVVFTTLAVTLFTVGFCLLMRIRKNFPRLHNGYRCYLWSALVALTIPLTLRSLLDMTVENIVPDNDYSIAVYNVIFTLLTDFLPVVC